VVRPRADDRQRPEVVNEERAEYPELARRRGLEADVVARVEVAATGRVASVEVVTCSVEGFGFEDAAREALQDFEFRPATVEGEPVARTITYTYRFRLD
jgi:TonB family protein